jgi:hypothetical protein
LVLFSFIFPWPIFIYFHPARMLSWFAFSRSKREREGCIYILRKRTKNKTNRKLFQMFQNMRL